MLAMSERQGVEIDYCPQCRGVWLDRGELDKLVDKVEAAPVAVQRSEPRYESRDQPRYDSRDDPRYDRSSGDNRPKKKKSSFLGELMDF